MRKLIAISVSGLVALALAGSASAQGSEGWFHTPSMNIRCVVDFTYTHSDIVCQTANNRRAVSLGHGRAKVRRLPLFPLRGHVMPYGTQMRGPRLVCVSLFDGLECQAGLHGFWINRDRIDAW
jgi:hypothetical protein